MGTLDGRVAIVTGGASGIGAVTARLSAAEDAAVVVADVLFTAGGGWRMTADFDESLTAAQPLPRLGEPEEVARMVLNRSRLSVRRCPSVDCPSFQRPPFERPSLEGDLPCSTS